MRPDQPAEVESLPTESVIDSDLPSLALAYLGDAVYELFVRSLLLSQGKTKVSNLHTAAVQYVRAPAQAALLQHIEPLLTPEEKDIVRRGRNAKPGHIPRSADGLTYHQSTAFEALVGYLYASGQTERLQTILEEAPDDLRFVNLQDVPHREEIAQ